jgi:hypothetical protein
MTRRGGWAAPDGSTTRCPDGDPPITAVSPSTCAVVKPGCCVGPRSSSSSGALHSASASAGFVLLYKSPLRDIARDAPAAGIAVVSMASRFGVDSSCRPRTPCPSDRSRRTRRHMTWSEAGLPFLCIDGGESRTRVA